MERNLLLEEFFIRLQSSIWSLIKEREENLDPEEVVNVVAVDAAYGEENMVVAAVKWDVRRDIQIGAETFACKPPYPYVPGLLFLREGPPMLEAVQLLGSDWQLLLVDGHGILHPRRMGLATLLGFILKKPALGIAKSLLIGEERADGTVSVGGEVLGYRFKFKGSRRFYASPGYMISVKQIPEIIQILGGKYPEPLRRADILSRETLRKMVEG